MLSKSIIHRPELMGMWEVQGTDRRSQGLATILWALHTQGWGQHTWAMKWRWECKEMFHLIQSFLIWPRLVICVKLIIALVFAFILLHVFSLFYKKMYNMHAAETCVLYRAESKDHIFRFYWVEERENKSYR